MKNRIIAFLRSQNFKNAAWNLGNTVSFPLLVLLATPFFIQRLGAEQYGIWMLINTTTQLMSILNLGLGDTAIKYISRYKAIGEEWRIRETTAAIIGIGLVVFVLALLLGAGLYAALQKTDWFSITPAMRTLAAKSAFLAFALFGLKFQEQIVLSIFQGYERYDVASAISLSSRVLILLGNVIFVYFGFSLLEVFASSSVLLFFFLLLEMGYAKSKFPAIQLSPSYRIGPIRSVFSFGIWSWLQSLMAIVTTQTDKFIVAYFSGVQLLTFYSLGSLLTTQIHGMFASVSAWVFPSVSKRVSQDEPLPRFYKKADVALLSFGFTGLIVFLLIEKLLLVFWLGEDTYIRAIPFIRVFIYYNLFLLLNILPFYFLNGAGYIKQNTFAELIAKVLNIGGMILGYVVWGTVGLIWGLVFSMLISTPIRISMLRRYVLKIKNPFRGMDVLLSPALIVLFFETQNPVFKAIFAGSFCFVFYLLYLRFWKRELISGKQ